MAAGGVDEAGDAGRQVDLVGRLHAQTQLCPRWPGHAPMSARGACVPATLGMPVAFYRRYSHCA
jgi:hypothetical protein